MTVVAGAGSNDTRHAVHLTERATELGADAILSVTPYYNRPDRRGVLAHYAAIAEATDRPIVLYNIPSRTALDLPNDLLAELAQLPGIDYVKQANAANLAPVDGLQVYAGNDDMLAEVLDLGGPGGILVASHVVGDDHAQHGRRARPPRGDRRFAPRPLRGPRGSQPDPDQGGAQSDGPASGGLRLPMLEADDEAKAEVRAMLERHGLVPSARR